MKARISRRDFLEKGSKGLIGVAMVPYFLKPNLAKAFAAPAASEMGLRDYYAHFVCQGQILYR